MVMAEDTPVPDPTILTTEQLLREVASIEKLVHALIDGGEKINAEKFKAVDEHFKLVEQQRVEQKKDTKDAVDAALAAAKEAVKEQTTASGLAITKSENGAKEQSNQQNATFTTAINGLTNSHNDLKDRVNTIETTTRTIDTSKSQNVNYVLITVTVASFIVAGVLGVIAAVKP